MKSNLPAGSASSSSHNFIESPNLQHIVRLAARLLNVPVVFVLLVDETERQQATAKNVQPSIVATHGLNIASIEIDSSPVAAALQRREFFSMSRPDGNVTTGHQSDSTSSWLVSESSNLAWFASMPICEPSGYFHGILGILSQEEQIFAPDDLKTLTDLSTLIAREIHLSYEERSSIETTKGKQAPPAASGGFSQSIEHLQLALQAGDMGTWDWNVLDNSCQWSEELALLLGRPLNEIPPSAEGFLSCVHPEDRGYLLKHFEGATRDGMYEAEYRIIKPNGEVRWMASRGKSVHDATGQVTHVRGITADVTKRHEAEEALRESRERFKSAFEYSMLGFALVGLNGCWLQVNQALCQILGYTTEELRATDVQSITHPEDRAADSAALQRALKGEITTYQREKRYLHRDGHVVWTQVSVSLLRNNHKQPLYFIGQVQDITQRKRDEAALLAAKEEAENANRAKSEFISRMSHELRTPLNAILGFSQLLDLSDLKSRDRESLNQISQAGRHLLKMINELLDIAHIESGSLSVSLEPVNMAEIIIEVLNLVRPQALQRGIELHEDKLGSCDWPVMADPQRFKQVLLNLLSNAINYNRKNGAVHLHCECRDTVLHIAVEDTGPGIAPEQIPRLFTPFDRLGAERTEIEGTGVGLALSKRLVEAMSGRIGVHSTPGTGSTFWVELPLSETLSHLSGVPSRLKAPDTAAPAPHSILYIEANLSDLKLIQRLLERRPSIRLLSAMQGSLGIELARQHRPSMILLDFDLPATNGEELLHRLRSDRATQDIPIVIICVDSSTSQVRQWERAGVEKFLRKPLDLHEFMKMLDSIVPSTENTKTENTKND